MSSDQSKVDGKSKMRRRDFLRNSGAAIGGAVAAPGSILASPFRAEEPKATEALASGASALDVTAPATGSKSVSVLDSGRPMRLCINQEIEELRIDPHWTLIEVLRNELGLVGTKRSCDRGQCGLCTVLIDGRPIMSCMTLAATCEGKKIETIEGLQNRDTRELHPIQKAFKDHWGYQCGTCVPGAIMTTKALLAKNPKPTLDEIKEALAGVICRCGDYHARHSAILAAAENMSAKRGA
jgi:carbon-monoxide dehydrogenase small subunit